MPVENKGQRPKSSARINFLIEPRRRRGQATRSRFCSLLSVHDPVCTPYPLIMFCRRKICAYPQTYMRCSRYVQNIMERFLYCREVGVCCCCFKLLCNSLGLLCTSGDVCRPHVFHIKVMKSSAGLQIPFFSKPKTRFLRVKICQSWKMWMHICSKVLLWPIISLNLNLLTYLNAYLYRYAHICAEDSRSLA